jgi:DNA-binding response OmpR family regulator
MLVEGESKSLIEDPIRILFADDDLDIQQAVCFVLEEAGMEVHFASDGAHALDLWRAWTVDLVILDVMMPIMDGWEVCQYIRRQSNIPIIMLTARGREDDVVRAFKLGADDYIIKPLRPRELVARVHAVLRRINQQVDAFKLLACGNLIMDLDSHRVTYRGQNVQMSPMEFKLLKYLMEHTGVVLSKEDLLENVWGYPPSAGDMNLIEATVRRLRKKVENDPSHPHYIKTVWGTGYRFGD